MKRLTVLLCTMATLSCAGPDTSPRPESRPNPVADATIDRSATENTQGGFFKSLRPIFRSPKAGKQQRPQQAALAAGSVCGDPSIQGEVIGTVPGRIAGCGIENAVSIASVSGVSLSTKSKMDCGAARALKTWVDSSAKPALSSKGGGCARSRSPRTTPVAAATTPRQAKFPNMARAARLISLPSV